MVAFTGNVPVFMRIGTGDERVIGSLAVRPVRPGAAGEPVKVQVAGGLIAMATLLEHAAAELRSQHAKDGDAST